MNAVVILSHGTENFRIGSVSNVWTRLEPIMILKLPIML